MEIENNNIKCRICPRKCGVDRRRETGFCGMYDKPGTALYMLHRWEEPFISGTDAGRGSGTVFFKGCPLKCVYCQNHKIAFYTEGGRNDDDDGNRGKLADIFLELQAAGAYNINLVTPTHFTSEIIGAVREAKEKGLGIPVVWNTSGFELPGTVALLKETVDVYLTDFKYYRAEPALRYSGAPGYFEAAAAALDVMVRQKPALIFDGEGILKSGVAVRHMTLPGLLSDSCRILEYLYRKYGDNILISIMSQYTPQKTCDFNKYPELKNKVPQRQYGKLVAFAERLGITNAFIQGGAAVSESFTPEF